MKFTVFLILIAALFSCQKKTTKVISVTDQLSEKKALEKKDHKITNRKCINFLALENRDIYPLTEQKLDTDEMYDLLSTIDYSFANTPEEVKSLMCDGGLNCDINCKGGIQYNLVSHYCDGEKHFVNLAIIQGEKIDIKKLHGTYVHDFKDIDKYSFVLDYDNLEVTKTNYTNTNNYVKKEVSKEVTKYKLTDQGIVKL